MAVAPRDGAALVDLWAMAAELERQFAGYKQRFPERGSSSPGCCMDDDDDPPEQTDAAALDVGDGGCNGHVEEDDDGGGGGGGVRGRMYEAYTRRRDERLRTVWRARMERKEAEVMAIWARLRGGGGGPTAAPEDDDDDDRAAGEEAQEDGERRRSSDVAAPGRVPEKKHPRPGTRRSFSSANLTRSSRPDAGLRRALSQEPLPPEPPTAGASRPTHGNHRTRAVSGAAPKRKGSATEMNGSLIRQAAGLKPPRGGLPRPGAGMEAVVPPNASVAASASLQGRSVEQPAAASDRDDEAPKASPTRPFVGISGNIGAGNARAASPESECGSEVVNGAAGAEADSGEAKEKNAVVDLERREGEEIAVQSPDPEAKVGNGEITSDSETEQSYVFIKKMDEKPMRLSDALAGSDAEPHLLEVKNGTGSADVEATRTDDAGISATENAESSTELSSFSGTGRSGRGSAPSSPPSCSSRAQSVERLLVEDAALLRKKREDRGATNGGRSGVQAVSTPGSAGRRASGGAARTTTSPRGTGIGFKKRFLSFGKKTTRGGDGATVMECSSPASVPSPVDHHRSSRRRCRTADDAIRPRMVGSSSDAAASDDSPQACSLQSLVAASPARSELSEMVPLPQEKSPKSHRSFFSFRSFNCGRG